MKKLNTFKQKLKFDHNLSSYKFKQYFLSSLERLINRPVRLENKPKLNCVIIFYLLISRIKAKAAKRIMPLKNMSEFLEEKYYKKTFIQPFVSTATASSLSTSSGKSSTGLASAVHILS